MPKTPSGKLFRIIKSLSGSEKRYFKIFVGNKGGKNNKYIRLFDAIDAQETFDEETLKALIYGDAPIGSRKYSELKAYLYELILKSLQSFDEKTSVDYKLKGMLQSVRALFKRSHFEDCREILQKAKKLANKYEEFNAVLEIFNWEKKIAYAKTDISFLDNELKNIDSQEKACLDHLRNISDYRHLFFKFLISIRKDVSRREKQVREFNTLIKHPLLSSIDKANSHKAKVLYLRIFSIFYFSISDFNQFYASSKTLLDFMESKPHFLKEDVSEYISVLNNHVISCGRLGKINEVRATLNKFSKIKPNTFGDELALHRQYYMNKFRLCISTGEFHEGLKELERHKATMKKFDEKQFSLNTFYLQYFSIYFGVQDYENALESLNEWLNLSRNIDRKDLQSLARILNLIIHYELGTTLLLDSLLRSTYRYLNKENRLFDFERKFLSFIKYSTKAHSKKEMKKTFETLKEDFEKLSNDPSFGIFQMFDLIAWLESKISAKPFAQVVKERHQRQISNL